MIYSIGCDVAKNLFVVCLLAFDRSSQNERILGRAEFENSPEGYKAFLSWMGEYVSMNTDTVRCTMEATGVYYEGLALFLQDQCPAIHLSVVLPSHAKYYVKSKGNRSKTDPIDALGLSQMGAESVLAEWGGIDAYWRELREYTRNKHALQKQQTQVKNRIHAHKHSGNPSKDMLDILEDLLDTFKQQIEQIDRLITQHIKAAKKYKKQIQCLLSITGIGTHTVAAVLAETNGFERFTSKAQLISFSGYDVAIRKSGTYKGVEKISKQGSPLIRKAMYMPASTIIARKKGPVYAYYKRLSERSDVNMKAHVAVQKKLLSYMYYLWKREEQFDPNRIATDRMKGNSNKCRPTSWQDYRMYISESA